MLSEVTTAAPKRPGILFVVSSPSGGGKGTLVDRLLKAVPDLSFSISYTTRTPRDGEVNGREYFFVTRQEFEGMMKVDEFLESAEVHSNLYGTSRQQVLEQTAAGHDIVLEVDVQGAASVRKLALDSVSIFIVPPSFELLQKRLLARGTDSPAQLEIRLRKAPEELKDYKLFDYVIINDDLDRAAAQLTAIVWAERTRRTRQEQIIGEVLRSFPAQ